MVMSEEKVGRLEEEARKRKERLAAFKRRRECQSANDASTEDGKIPLPKPMFRSYRPIDDTLKENEIPDAAPGDIESLVTTVDTSSNDQNSAKQDLEMAQLAPRKPDWDLKRDLTGKLERLERRTQRAIAELIRERLQTERRPEDLVAAVSHAGSTAAQDDD